MRGGEPLEYAHLQKELVQLPLDFPASEDVASPAKYGGWIGKPNPDSETRIRATPLPT